MLALASGSSKASGHTPAFEHIELPGRAPVLVVARISLFRHRWNLSVGRIDDDGAAFLSSDGDHAVAKALPEVVVALPSEGVAGLWRLPIRVARLVSLLIPGRLSAQELRRFLIGQGFPAIILRRPLNLCVGVGVVDAGQIRLQPSGVCGNPATLLLCGGREPHHQDQPRERG